MAQVITPSSAETSPQLCPDAPVVSWEEEVIRYTVSLATAFSLPKSVGQIFGLIFSSARPLCLDEVVERLGISKGSASSGLNFLLKMTAIQAVELEGDRRMHYVPEISLRRLAQGLLEQTIIPHLQEGSTALDSMESHLVELEKDDRVILAGRLQALRVWEKKARTLLPFLLKFLGKPLDHKRKIAPYLEPDAE
jgi:DNA-binding transcriptional regulator GbsR (MarR family)